MYSCSFHKINLEYSNDKINLLFCWLIAANYFVYIFNVATNIEKMQKCMIHKLKIILLIPFVFLLIQSCSIIKPSQVKQAEKIEKQQKKEAEEAYELLKEDHINRQSELAKKRMETTKKRSAYLNMSKKRPTFWQRIFGKRDKRK